MTPLFSLLDTLGMIARMMHPSRLDALVDRLDAAGDGVIADQPAAAFALKAVAGLRAAPTADNPMLEAYRALRWVNRSIEALAAVAETDPQVSRYLLPPSLRDDPEVRQRLAAGAGQDCGAFHTANEIGQRGGYSVYVPPGLTGPAPLVMALHGGSGHGRLFLWNWVAEARGRGLIVVAPTSAGPTWSLMEPDTDGAALAAVLSAVRRRWPVDPARMLLMGMSDGGTFTLLSGLSEDSPFTHLAPVAASFHPMLLAIASPERVVGLPVHLTHGALDWMFPVDGARVAARMLRAAGASVLYRELADLSHAYPRDGQEDVVDWLLNGP